MILIKVIIIGGLPYVGPGSAILVDPGSASLVAPCATSLVLLAYYLQIRIDNSEVEEIVGKHHKPLWRLVHCTRR